MEKSRKIVVLSLKIGIGSSLAFFIATTLGLQYAVSAGTITLLTLMTSKLGTLELAVCRLATFTMTVIIAWQLYSHIENMWLAYGLLLVIITAIAGAFSWRGTISVNAVISAHLITSGDFSDAAVWNEFQLVLIGVVLALLFNLLHLNGSQRKHIIANMKSVENRLQMIVGELAAYLSNKEMERNVWDDICGLEQDMLDCINEAYEYQDNSFQSHPAYYIEFFKMRYHQCQVLHNLHYEMKKIRSMPSQAKVVADYMMYLTDYITERNNPEEQMRKLEEIVEQSRNEELPGTREEFESRALLYHIVMDLEEFLKFKMRFIKGLNEEQRKIWEEKESKVCTSENEQKIAENGINKSI